MQKNEVNHLKTKLESQAAEANYLAEQISSLKRVVG